MKLSHRLWLRVLGRAPFTTVRAFVQGQLSDHGERIVRNDGHFTLVANCDMAVVFVIDGDSHVKHMADGDTMHVTQSMAKLTIYVQRNRKAEEAA